MAGTVVLTGAAGFIGFHTAQALLSRGETVVGVDNLNAYYDPALKYGRLDVLRSGRYAKSFRFVEGDLTDKDLIHRLICNDTSVDRVIHLGAQAGVRHSLQAPFSYVDANVTGHLSVLEAVRATSGRVPHLVYASSSSVYGMRSEGPFTESDPVDRPVSLYAATKRADELISESYCSLYGIAQSGLRFFTVYGPWGRPDMAYWLFTQAIFEGRPIEVFNEGRMLRDFTYVDDIVAGILATMDFPASAGVNRILNLGNNHPERLIDLISHLEALIGRQTRKIMRPMQPGDVVSTYADITKIASETGWTPSTTLVDGLERFVSWYRDRFDVR